MLMPAYWPPAAGLSSLLLPQADEQAGALLREGKAHCFERARQCFDGARPPACDDAKALGVTRLSEFGGRDD